LLTRRQRIAVGLAMCLPVPVLAATGLSLPLPSGVYRLATELVAGTAALATHGQAGVAAPQSGRIVLSQHERARLAAVVPAATVSAIPALHLRKLRLAPGPVVPAP